MSMAPLETLPSARSSDDLRPVLVRRALSILGARSLVNGSQPAPELIKSPRNCSTGGPGQCKKNGFHATTDSRAKLHLRRDQKAWAKKNFCTCPATNMKIL